MSLNEETIVQAALRIVAKDGMSGLSMRSLARELNVSQMGAYHYVKNKRELLVLVANEAMRRVTLAPDEGSWTDQVKRQCELMLEEIDQWPDLGDIVIQIPLTRSGFLIVEHFVEILRGAGFSEEGAVNAYALIETYLVGRLHLTARGSVGARHSTGDRPDVVDRATQAAVSKGAAHLDFSLETLVTGLEAMLAKYGAAGTKKPKARARASVSAKGR